ncbi:MAG TPA: DMT family transporter [Proteobacteria bacterium]|nr:putative DMT superfamily transporter inner membrane protein [bacterium BMS3Abin14]HDL52988.1 DMT family transporter [Pseudomonadota bacterium]
MPARPKNSIPVSGAALLILVCLVWGGNMVSIKFSNQGVPPMIAATIRSAVAASLLWGLVALRGKSVWLKGQDLKYGVTIGVLFGFDFLFLYWGTAFTIASRAIIFLYTHSIWAALGAHFFLEGDRLTPVKTSGLILAFIGVVSVFGVRSAHLPPHYWIGDLMEVVAALFWATTTLYIKRVSGKRPIDHYQTLFAQLFFSIPVLILGWLLLDLGKPVTLTGPVIGALLYQTLIVAFFSYILWFWMIHTYPVSRLAAFIFLAPLFGVLLGGILQGDPLPFQLWLGLGCVASGIYLVNRPQPA